MKKYIVFVLLLVFFATMFFGCHPTGVGGTTVAATDTGQATEESPPTESPHSTTATSETAITTSEDPTNYEPSETGNTTVSESAHESTEPNTEETTEAGTTEPKPTEPTPTNPPHTHSWSAWTQTKAPTCTEPGTETRTCSCGATETRPVNALGHTWQETAPTCTEAGSKTCKTCGKQETGAAALGHDWVHHDEEGEYRPVITCYCGMRFIGKPGDGTEAYAAWNAHVASFDREEADAHHGGFEMHDEWFVTKAAYDSCSRCHATR